MSHHVRSHGGRRAGEHHCDVLFVVAGLAGFSAVYHLEPAGYPNYRLIEAEDRPGGWVKTDWSGPWGADRAIHVLYFRSPEMRQWVGELLGGRWHEHIKSCIISSAGVRTPFPFHANLCGCPKHVVLECLDGLWEAILARERHPSPAVTFADWITLSSGSGVARHFMNPYNTRMWTVPPSEMGGEWMGDFVPAPDPHRILEGHLPPAIGASGSTRGFTTRPVAPPSWPGARIPSPADQVLDPARRDRCRRARRKARRRIPHSIQGAGFEHALRALASLLEPLPTSEQSAANRLESIDLLLADVGFVDPEFSDVHWANLPDPDVLA